MSHLLHLNDLRCTFSSCWLNISLNEKVLSHWGCLCGFSPVCSLMWHTRLLFVVNVRLHSLYSLCIFLLLHLECFLHYFYFTFCSWIIWHLLLPFTFSWQISQRLQHSTFSNIILLFRLWDIYACRLPSKLFV